LGPNNVELVASQLFIFIAFTFTGVLALLAALISGPPVAAALESGIALGILARPVSRSSYYLGTWLGVAMLLCAYTIGAGGLEMLVVWQTTNYIAPDPAMVLAGICAMGIVLSTLTLTLSTRLGIYSAAIISVAGFFVCWLSGIAGTVGTALHNDTLQNAGTVSQLLLPTDGLWRSALYGMEPASVLSLAQAFGPGSAANPFLAAHPQSLPYLSWCVGWVVLVALAGILSMSRREI
jgi:ABC-type transport system involved in multi-copper enzyme maturation permease subunit